MEEQALLLRENLINIRSVLVTNRKKINKLTYKQNILEQENARRKKVRMREKIMETPKNIGKSLKGVGDKAVNATKKSGLGNALGLIAIIAIAQNIEGIKSLVDEGGYDVEQLLSVLNALNVIKKNDAKKKDQEEVKPEVRQDEEPPQQDP